MKSIVTILFTTFVLYTNASWSQQFMNQIDSMGNIHSPLKKSTSVKRGTDQLDYSIKIKSGESVKDTYEYITSVTMTKYGAYNDRFLNVPSFINIHIDKVYTESYSFPPSVNGYYYFADLTISAASNATPGEYAMQVVFYFYLVQGGSLSETDTIDLNVTIYNQPPDKPQLTFPADNSVNQHKNIVLRWNDLPAATSYIAQLSTDQSFVSIVKADTTTKDTVYITGLSGAQKYYWRVQASNSLGASSWSDTRNFTTGLEWEKTNAPESYIYCFARNRNDLYAGTWGSGVLHSTDDGMNWTPMNNGLTYLNINALLITGSNIFAGTNTGIFLSPDKGSSWTKLNNSLYDVNAFAKIGNIIFAGTYHGNGVYYSTDNGTTWNNYPYGFRVTPAGIISLAVSGINLIAGSDNDEIFVSSDSSKTWRSVSNSFQLWSVFSNGNMVFSSMFKSTDNGLSWAQMNFGGYYFAQSGSNLFGCAPQWVWLSTDFGLTHTSVDLGFAPLTSFESIAVNLNYLFIGTADKGIWRRRLIDMTGVNPPEKTQLMFPGISQSVSTDTINFRWNSVKDATQYLLQVSRDQSFTSIVNKDSITTDTAIILTKLPGSQKYYWRIQAQNEAGVSQWSDIWNFTSTLTGIETKENIPNEFSLSQNYPDPFNPTTTISFVLPSRSFVSMKIFDALGREVATIVSEEMPAGSYSRIWNAQNMSSGVYFYRLQAGSFTETKKLMVLK
jgi:hypothetical protein